MTKYNLTERIEHIIQERERRIKREETEKEKAIQQKADEKERKRLQKEREKKRLQDYYARQEQKAYRQEQKEKRKEERQATLVERLQNPEELRKYEWNKVRNTRIKAAIAIGTYIPLGYYLMKEDFRFEPGIFNTTYEQLSFVLLSIPVYFAITYRILLNKYEQKYNKNDSTTTKDTK